LPSHNIHREYEQTHKLHMHVIYDSQLFHATLFIHGRLKHASIVFFYCNFPGRIHRSVCHGNTLNFQKFWLTFSNLSWPLIFKFVLTVIFQICTDRYFSNFSWPNFIKHALPTVTSYIVYTSLCACTFRTVYYRNVQQQIPPIHPSMYIL
jgi:hypothetical protein